MKKNANVFGAYTEVKNNEVKRDAKVVKSTRKGVTAFSDNCSDLDGVCAQINSHWSDKVELDNGLIQTCGEWCEIVGIDPAKMKHGLTSKVLRAVWNKNMKHGKDMCMWRKVTATCGGKSVYEYAKMSDGTYDYVAVQTYHLVKIEKWTVRLLLQCLYDGWNYYGVLNKMHKNYEHNLKIKKYYVTESVKATRKSKSAKMRELVLESEDKNVELDVIEF